MPGNFIIGGYGSSPKDMDRIAKNVSKHYDIEFEGWALRPALDNPKLARRLKGGEVASHSAGMLKAIQGRPERLTAFAPPLPRRRMDLAGRAIKGNLGAVVNPERRPIAREILRGAVGELALHLVGHIGMLNRISRFNAFEAAEEARRDGVDVRIVAMEDDGFFRFRPEEEEAAARLTVPLAMLPGAHDEYLYDPVAMHAAAERVFDGRSALEVNEPIAGAPKYLQPRMLGRAATLGATASTAS